MIIFTWYYIYLDFEITKVAAISKELLRGVQLKFEGKMLFLEIFHILKPDKDFRTENKNKK